MKTVLVTGASGFIGLHTLAPLLARGYEVHAVCRKPPPEDIPGVRWHSADLFDPEQRAVLLASANPSHLLHLAWFVVPGQLISSPQNLDWVEASMALFRAFAARGGKRVVVCGSGYEYDWTYGYCLEAQTPLAPDTIYGASKHALHLLLRSFASGAGLEYAWGRVFFLYGPHEHPQRLVSSVIRNVIANKPAPCSHGRQMRDYMHVQDVADGLVAMLDSSVQGALNVASNHATTLREIVLTIGRLTNREELIQLGAIPARANDKPLVIGDNTRLVSELGWQPKLDLESGLRQTIDWWQKHPDEGAGVAR
jgi:nucleoside-diphosphate-sugar epimerase